MHNLASFAWKEKDAKNAIAFVIKVEKIPLKISKVLQAGSSFRLYFLKSISKSWFPRNL